MITINTGLTTMLKAKIKMTSEISAMPRRRVSTVTSLAAESAAAEWLVAEERRAGRLRAAPLLLPFSS